MEAVTTANGHDMLPTFVVFQAYRATGVVGIVLITLGVIHNSIFRCSCVCCVCCCGCVRAWWWWW